VDNHMIEVLRDFQEELIKQRPNLEKVYPKWARPNFDDFAVTVNKLYDEGHLSMPEENVVKGGDDDIPVDVVVSNIRITEKGRYYFGMKE
jgi:hypothetical protein